jgi:SAM-dependent methyltransferase
MSAGAGWAEGYVTDVSYTNSYFRELSPTWLNYVAAINGAHPRPLDRDFTHIDLGCGLGQSSVVLAACFPEGRFFGVDFNPAHIDIAQRAARRLGLDNVTFIERAFEELLAVDLPAFDFITLHGIYTWISEGARKAAQRFIYEKLKPGGIVYNSYNCLPGWSGEAPIRRLLYEFAEVHHGDSAARAEAAAKDAQALANLKLGYFHANPSSVDHIGKLPNRQANYLAHEYLNAAWNPFYSVDVADEMAAGKLSYLGSATLLDNQPELVMSDPATAECRKQPTERLRQLAQDYLTGQRFRRDVFVRGHPRLPRAEIARHLREQNLALAGPMSDFSEKAKVPRGEISFDAKLTGLIRESLSQGAMSSREIAARIPGKEKPANPAELERSLLMMTAAGKLVPVARAFQPAALPAKPDKIRIAHAINRTLVAQGRETMARQNLVSLQTGFALGIDGLDAVALSLLEEGVPAAKLVAAVAEDLKQRGIRINKDGKPVADAKEAEARTGEIVGQFMSRGLPTLLRFGIAEPA